LDRNGFEVVIGDVEDEGGDTEQEIYSGEGTRAYTTNLEIGIVVEIDPVGVSLGKSGKGFGSVEFCFELVHVVFTELEEIVGTVNGGGVSRGRVMIIVDEATYDGQIISSLDSRDEVVDEGFWKKNWGVLFSKRPSFVVVEIVRGFSFGMGTEWSR
jgi:hypothetical protein